MSSDSDSLSVSVSVSVSNSNSSHLSREISISDQNFSFEHSKHDLESENENENENENDKSNHFDGIVSGVLSSSSSPEIIIDTMTVSRKNRESIQIHSENENETQNENEIMNQWKPEWMFSGDEFQKDEAKKLWFVLFFVSVVCFLFSIVSISTGAIYSMSSTTNSKTTFHYGYFSACIFSFNSLQGVNIIMCDSYSNLQNSIISSPSTSTITDFQIPSGLYAAKVFSVFEVISLSILILFFLLLLRFSSSSSSRIFMYISILCIFILIYTIISLLCLIIPSENSDRERGVMFGGVFQILICLAMTGEAITMIILKRRGQKFAGICNSDDNHNEVGKQIRRSRL